MNTRLMQEYLQLIDPSASRPIGTGYRLGPNKRDFKDHIVPTSAAVVEYFRSMDPRGNMWICAAPRRNHTAGLAKGGAARSRVAWADYDEKLDVTGGPLSIPDVMKPHVWTVRSGSDGNYHVYIVFDGDGVAWRDLTLINWMWTRVLNADPSGFADNKLLRLPGSFNAKNGAQVVPEVPLSRVVPIAPVACVRVLAGLLGMDKHALGIKRDVITRLSGRGGGSLAKVHVPDERRRLLPMARRLDLRANQFRTRGNRSNSRFGFWRDFWKAGLTLDEVYSLMLTFDPVRDVFDWEGDLVRCWGKYEAERA